MHVVGEQAKTVAVPEQDLQHRRLLAAERKQVARERIFLQHFLDQHGEPIHAFPHVGVAERHVHLHTSRNDQHDAISPLSARARTTSGSLSFGAKTRLPSASSTAIIPSGGCTRSRRRRAGAVSSGRATGTSFARFFWATPNSTRQRNSSPVTMPCLRATPETVAPGCSVSITIASFCSSLKKRRAGVAGAWGTSLRTSVKLLSEVDSLALVLTSGRAEG